jgi:hypothetical protein
MRKQQIMKSQQREILELETELVQLATLVRKRRKALERLRNCPNSNCQCRLVWSEQVDKNLARQVRKIRRQLGNSPAKVKKLKTPA